MQPEIGGMPGARSARRCALLLGLAAALPAVAVAQQISLDARADGDPVSLSRAALPASFAGPAPDLLATLQWRPVRPGLDWTELNLTAGTLRLPVRAVLARIDPARFHFRLTLATESNRLSGAWTVDAAPADAALAVNAGQFLETGPWGWVVLEGREHREPGRGPLAVGFAVDTAGRIRWLPEPEVAGAAGDPAIVYAFQSYPLLLHEGRVPALTRDRTAVSHDHRDARLVLAELPDGALLLVLTRYGALGGVAQRVPIGLTLPETVLLVGALGARHAVMLDGGVSAQLLLRSGDGAVHTWRGLRKVPLALVATPRN
jgi:hypothetical protein